MAAKMKYKVELNLQDNQHIIKIRCENYRKEICLNLIVYLPYNTLTFRIPAVSRNHF